MTLLTEYEAQEQWRDWDAMLARLPIAPQQSVLDLGCGPGAVSARLSTRAATVIGIDRNADLLDAARRRCPANCRFIEADLMDLAPDSVPPADGLWSSFAAAYFPDFAPVLRRWVSCLAPGGWIALVDIDDLWRGHHPLPEDTEAAFAAFADHARAEGFYDCRMGRRLAAICREVGLKVTAQHRMKDAELAFDGPASPHILEAWQRRFARKPMMKAFLGADRFDAVTQRFLETISRPDHRSTASIVIVQAELPAKD